MRKRIDFLVLILMLIFSYFFSSYLIPLGMPYIFSIFIFFIPPIFYLGYREKKNWEKVIAGVFSFGVLLTLFFFFLLELNNAWMIRLSIFDYRVFNVLAIEEVIIMQLLVGLVFIYYQHFLLNDKNKKYYNNKLPKRYFKITKYLILLLLIISIVYYNNPAIFIFKLSYFKLSILPLSLLILFVFINPKYLRKIILMIPYFFLLFFVIDILSVKFNILFFDGDYLMIINLFGIKFPIEEIVVYFTFYAPILIGCYETCINMKENY